MRNYPISQTLILRRCQVKYTRPENKEQQRANRSKRRQKRQEIMLNMSEKCTGLKYPSRNSQSLRSSKHRSKIRPSGKVNKILNQRNLMKMAIRSINLHPRRVQVMRGHGETLWQGILRVNNFRICLRAHSHTGIVPIHQPEQDLTSLVKHNSQLTERVKEVQSQEAIKQMDAINQEGQVRVMSLALGYDVIQPRIQQRNCMVRIQKWRVASEVSVRVKEPFACGRPIIFLK